MLRVCTVEVDEAVYLVIDSEVESSAATDVWVIGTGSPALIPLSPTTAVLITVFVRISVASGSTSTVLCVVQASPAPSHVVSLYVVVK